MPENAYQAPNFLWGERGRSMWVAVLGSEPLLYAELLFLVSDPCTPVQPLVLL